MAAATRMAERAETAQLHFQGPKAADIAGSLSAVEQVDDALWLAGDEVTTVERLLPQDARRFGAHASLDLREVFGLVSGKQDEIDLEGLAFDDTTGQLWFVGSHSQRRGKNKEKEPTLAGELAALGPGAPQPNRYLMGTIDIRAWTTAGEGKPPAFRKADARFLPREDTGNALTRTLRANPIFAPFMDIPSKDNGFDIEGLAVRAGQLFIGLRGPVMNGWASILQCAPPHVDDRHLSITRADGALDGFHHLLDLDGLGVRDLCVHGDDLLILAGPTMKPERPFIVYRWRDGAVEKAARLVSRPTCVPLFELPSGGKTGNPEGITVFREAGEERLLVVHDRKPESKDKTSQNYVADLFRLD